MAKAPRLTAEEKKNIQHERMQRVLAGGTAFETPELKPDKVLDVTVNKLDLPGLRECQDKGTLVKHASVGADAMVFLGFIGAALRVDGKVDGSKYVGKHYFRAATQEELDKGDVKTTFPGLSAEEPRVLRRQPPAPPQPEVKS